MIYGDFRPNGQRCEAFLGNIFCAVATQFFPFVFGERSDFRVTERFDVGVLWTVSSPFVSPIVVTLDDGIGQLLDDVVFGRNDGVEIPHAFSECLESFGQASILRCVVRFPLGCRRDLMT